MEEAFRERIDCIRSGSGKWKRAHLSLGKSWSQPSLITTATPYDRPKPIMARSPARAAQLAAPPPYLALQHTAAAAPAQTAALLAAPDAPFTLPFRGGVVALDADEIEAEMNGIDLTNTDDDDDDDDEYPMVQ